MKGIFIDGLTIDGKHFNAYRHLHFILGVPRITHTITTFISVAQTGVIFIILLFNDCQNARMHTMYTKLSFPKSYRRVRSSISIRKNANKFSQSKFSFYSISWNLSPVIRTRKMLTYRRHFIKIHHPTFSNTVCAKFTYDCEYNTTYVYIRISTMNNINLIERNWSYIQSVRNTHPKIIIANPRKPFDIGSSSSSSQNWNKIFFFPYVRL